MKKSILLAMFLMISATLFAQFPQINTRTQYFKNTPVYSLGGSKTLVLNSATNRMETIPQGLITSIETDSARKYTFTGSAYCNIKYPVRDTILLTNTNYTGNQKFTFFVTASGADTTVFVPSSGNVNGSSTFSLIGTNNSVSLFFDATNYWITK